MSPSIWFITGASSGIGRAMTERVLKNGDIAIATLRKPEALSDLQTQYDATKLLVLRLDVTKPQEIRDAFAQAKEAYGRVDVVFNNAGYSVLAEAEGTPDDAARAMFEVNFWGAANVSREAVAFFREENKPSGGRLLNVSSIIGLAPGAGLGYYAATKHALEGFTESLALELDPEWNIKISLIEFGGFATKGVDNMVRAPAHPAYTKPSLASVQMRDWLLNKDLRIGGDPAKAVSKVYELAKLPDPPMRLALGKETVSTFRDVMKGIAADVDKYESWSKDLQLDN